MTNSWAALFDWDGVIIDSSAQHEKSWERMSREDGLPLAPDYFKHSFGMKNENIIPDLLGWATDPEEVKRLSLRKESLYRAIVASDGMDALLGVEPWLKQLQATGVPCVIGSSSCRENIEVVIDQIGLRSYFKGIISGDDVVHGKPAPDIFLKAAAVAGVAPARCVVFEDAHVGIQAARRAEMKVVAVTTTHPSASFTDAEVVVGRLDDLDLAQLASWFSADR